MATTSSDRVPARNVTLRVRRWGKAYVVIVPGPIVTDLHITEGSFVEARLRKRR